ncbi:LacI family DNA-binding transcriptional regulator [Agromyces silvae]|uniref:LacI family DNA-binding transcriptional regulator n=1 Tax=Agromyces silvae TaxID=3388266 RepID=UPI00280AC8F6|nr:LacI family DNA-binding transcriptional regulator [Agromyces protaetiae]
MDVVRTTAKRTASMKDVARHAAVGLGTVSNVVNDLATVAPELRARVLESVHELGFVRNEAARHLRSGTSRTVVLLVPDSGNPFFTEISRGAGEVVWAEGRFPLIASAHGDASRENAYLGSFDSMRVHGLLASPVGDVSLALARLRTRGIPTVLVDARPPSDTYSAVRTDHVAGGCLATAHLLSSGRQRVDFLSTPAVVPQIADRIAGAKTAFRVHGLDPNSLGVWYSGGPAPSSGASVVERILALPRAERPEGFVVSNDVLAIEVMHAMLREGIRIPDDIAVVGYDDIPWAEAAAIPLSSVRQQSVEMGAIAARVLLDQITDEDAPREDCILAPELIVRESSAA